MMQAQDTFVMDMADGSQMRVAKGEVLPDNHPAVKAAKAGALFKPLDLDEEETPKPRAQAKHTQTRSGHGG